MIKKLALKGLYASLLLATPFAQAAVIDFDSFDNGQIIDIEYAPFVTISALNFSTGPDKAVIFDSSPSDSQIAANNTAADPDLMAPFTNNDRDLHNQGLADTIDPNNILIIQENGGVCDAFTCTQPDDEGSRPAGMISFDFNNAIELISLDFFDIESGENHQTPNNRIDLFDTDGNQVALNTYYTPDTGGDNMWSQILFDATDPDLKRIGRIDVFFGGSGALDNLVYNVSPVPVPAAFWLFGTALVGFIGYSRRRIV